jgi:hypothetical protein
VTGTIYVENNVGRALHDAINLFTHNHGWTAVWQHDIHPEMQRSQHGDEWWIRDIAGRGFAILTQDRAILDDPYERAVVVEAGASIIAFGDGNMPQWNKLRCLIVHWAVIERILAEPGPQAVTIWLTKHKVERFV